jgi:hypothetical protein
MNRSSKQLTSKRAYPGDRFRISGIDGASGSVTLMKCLFDGGVNQSCLVVSYSQFVLNYAPDKDGEFENMTYPANGPIENEKWVHKEYAAAAVTAIGALTRSAGAVQVLIRSKPRRGVFAMESYAVGQLLLVPTSNVVKCVLSDSEDAAKGLCMGGDAPAGHVLTLQPMIDKEMPVPAWCMRTVDKAGDANVKVTLKRVFIAISCSMSEIHNECRTIVIPMYENTVALTRGDEILVYRESIKAPKAKRAFAMVGAPSQAKAKANRHE